MRRENLLDRTRRRGARASMQMDRRRNDVVNGGGPRRQPRLDGSVLLVAVTPANHPRWHRVPEENTDSHVTPDVLPASPDSSTMTGRAGATGTGIRF